MNREQTMPDGGLYRPECEHDACGVGLVVNINGNKYHSVVEQGLCVLEHMAHRGAEGSDNKTGDGAGILVQIPHEFILLNGIPVPEKGRYGVGMVFLPRDGADQQLFMQLVTEVVEEQGLRLTASRNVPVDSSILGADAAATEPVIRQLFIVGCDDRQRLEELLYIVRKRIEFRLAGSAIRDKQSCYIVSLSTRTIVYKGMLSSRQLRHYFTDLQSPYFSSAIALVHSRFSTNTFPTWSLAQPFRLIGHNGEINTIRGNRLWMGTREAVLHPEFAGDAEGGLGPIIQPGMSDSASFDNALEFFLRGGMSLPHALAMLVPESFNEKNPLSKKLKSFYEYHSIFMAPWDGPAAVIFSDGRYAGGMLDRNGLRPARYLITRDGLMVIASETGVLDIPAADIESKGRLEPGKIVMVDTEQGQILFDDEIKSRLANEHPYDEWLHDNRILLKNITSGRSVTHEVENYPQLLRAFGYDREEIDRIIRPMAAAAAGPLVSMGDDTPIAVLSRKPQRFFNFFRQQFAQVTNPPMDSIREELVMSLTSYIGAVRKNILKPSPELCKVVMMSSPIISDRDLDILRHLEYKGFRTITLPMLFPVGGDGAALEKALGELCRAAEKAVDDGYNYMILSDRGVDAAHAAIPSLLAMSAVHHYLISRRKRSQIAVIVESGEVCETMHVALLMGYGASGVNPYMAFAILKALTASGELQLDFEAAERHYIKAVDKGMLKIMSKMGISTIRSYRGAALFEPLGVGEKLVAESGVGTIAAGVAKAKADKILISGCDGGTGASPADSMKYAGVPVEIGLAEIQQTLVLNRLRGRVRLQADGQLKCARDVLVSALLGAEEYGFGTAALVALGCRMLRKCHTNTCPMGVATQDPQLRERFTGTADRLINYFRLLAEDIRRRIAELGYERLDDLIGRSDLLRQRTAPPESPVARLDLRRLLHRPAGDADIRCRLPQEHALAEVPDQLLLPLADRILRDGKSVSQTFPIANTDRSVGAMLSGYVTRKCGRGGLPAEALSVTFRGSAGQSFGAFLAPGISFRLEGDANDYLGKGLSGGRIVVVPPAGSRFAAEGNVIAGNTLLYGATGGEAYIDGRVGERFCVRNSGATAVVEGVGDHGCEYMTGGRVAVLGQTGRNFAAGMSGGIAYVWNPRGDFDYYCNMEMVELTLLDNADDREELHRLIAAHVRHTDSLIGRRMLEEWERYAPQFIKVTPVEYRHYLESRKER